MNEDALVRDMWKNAYAYGRSTARKAHPSCTADADDLAQEAFLRLIVVARKADESRPEREQYGYFHESMRWAAWDASKRYTHGSTRHSVHVGKPHLENEEGHVRDWIEERVIDTSPPHSALVEQALDRHKSESRPSLTAREELVLAQDRDGASGREIADRLGMSEAAISIEKNKLRSVGIKI